MSVKHRILYEFNHRDGTRVRLFRNTDGEIVAHVENGEYIMVAKVDEDAPLTEDGALDIATVFALVFKQVDEAAPAEPVKPTPFPASQQQADQEPGI